MSRPNKEDYKVSLNKSSLIKWGEYSKAQDEYIDEIEEKLTACLDAESGFRQTIEDNKMKNIRANLLMMKNWSITVEALNLACAELATEDMPAGVILSALQKLAKEKVDKAWENDNED